MEFLYFLEGIRNSVLDIFFAICTIFGDELVLVSLFAIIYWCVNKTLACKIAFSYFLSGIMVQALKIHFRIDRPWVRDPDFKPVESALGTATGYSFPSGHTQSSTSLYGSISLHFKKGRFFAAALAVIALVMLSRMYLGCHTPQDVLVGFALAAVIACAVNFIFDNFNSSLATDIVVVVLVAAAGAGIFVYSSYLIAAGATTKELAMDGFKSAGAAVGFAAGWFIEKHCIRFNPKNSRFGIQILKTVIGLSVTVALKVGLKTLLGDTTFMAALRYFIIVFWIIALFPLCIKKFMRDRYDY